MYPVFQKPTLLLLCLLISGCVSTKQKSLDGGKSSAEISTDSESASQQLPGFDQIESFYRNNASFFELAKKITTKQQFSSYHDLQGAALRREAHKQNLLPQVTPVTSLNKDGDGVARLLVEQTLWDNGRYKAGKNFLSASEARATSLYRIQANERVADGIDAVLQYQKYNQLISLMDQLLMKYSVMNEMAVSRVQGGIGRRAEQSIFELKLLQIEAEKKDFSVKLKQSESTIQRLVGDVSSLGLNASFPLPEIALALPVGNDLNTIPEISEVLAEIDERKAELAQEKADGRPELRLSASAGDGTDLGLGADDQINNATLGFSFTKPLYWGANRKIKALEENVVAGEIKLSEQLVELEGQLFTLEQQSQFLHEALPEKKRIRELAEKRVEYFEQDFKAGTATMLEAVSILETAKSLSTQYIEAKYEFEITKLEQAKILGLLGPLDDF